MSATIGKVLCWAQRRLADAGIDEAKLEARLLLAHILQADTAALIARSDDSPPPGLASKLDPLLKRRAEREPLAHILGETEFYGLKLKTDARALVPRSDSEVVVDLALDFLPENKPVSIADLGTGTGCLLLALLKHRPEACGVGLDLDAGAAALARENARFVSLEDRVEIRRQSWIEANVWQGADLVVSNPPYIASSVIEGLAPEVRDHDPRRALDGGADGLEAYREIISLGKQRLKPGAVIVFEIGFDQDETVTDILECAGFEVIGRRKDLSGNDRALATRRPLPAH
ncbi:MAG: peptide chain release factor N(5)-glutamine methyltransferase [Pseudomonadota bacterium]